MTKKNHRASASTTPVVRCAIYTRKSTEEGLDQAFNSLDAQREAAEAYVRSQAHEGWVCLKERYDDGGFTGGNMERPALQHLLTDIKAGKIDAVVTYKVDRLSRSLLDFAKMMAVFEEHRVSFVSVTQQFNTATSMGRLILNVLLSFAQFEREMIAERTRDKIAATRRKGRWCGGMPILGYDIDRHSVKLVVNEEEAIRVRAIFALYLKHRGLLPTVEALARRGWHNKRWLTRKGRSYGGRPFIKTSLAKLLSNVTYLGKVKHKDEIHAGEHRGIVDEAVWQRVRELLEGNRTAGSERGHKPSDALLKGLLYCGACGRAMTPSYVCRKGAKRYRYYMCSGVLKRGRQSCPSRSVSAGAIEQFVVEQIRERGTSEVAAALDSGWERLRAATQAITLRRLIQRVDYDGVAGQVSIRFVSSDARVPAARPTQPAKESLV
jgi:site-specific DNA recombinase